MSTAAKLSMQRRRILVLGAANVLGAHLCERLLADGHEVIAVDDFTTGSFATLAHLKHNARFAFVEHDVTTKFDAHVDGVFHLALPSSERSYATDPVRAALVGVAGTANALEVAAQHDARVVIATSTERYGEGVRCAERLALDISNARRADVRIVRVATAYGPRMALDDAHVIPRLVVQALRGDDLVVDAQEAEQIERLSYVDDAVDTLVDAMNGDPPHAPLVAPFVEATVEEIASTILEVVIGGTQASPERPVSLEEGILRTLRSIEERLTSLRAPESGFFDKQRRADVGT